MRHRLLLVLLATPVLAACELPPLPYGDGSGRTVFVTGDSLVAEAEALVTVALALDGGRVAVRAADGSDIGWAAARLEDQLQLPPDVAVVAAGTNSWPGGWDRRDRRAVRDVVRLAAGVGCVVWVTPATHVWEGGRRRRARFYDTVVAAVEAAADAEPNLRVARWDRHAASHGDWYADDGVHHSDAGRAAYAAFIRDSVRELCPA